MLIKRLAKEEFYEITCDLLEVHKNEEFLKSIKDSLLKDFLLSEWKNGNKDKIVKRLVEYLE